MANAEDKTYNISYYTAKTYLGSLTMPQTGMHTTPELLLSRDSYLTNLRRFLDAAFASTAANLESA